MAPRFAVDLHPGGLQETLSAIEADGATARTFVADETKAEQVEAYVEAAVDLGGGEIHAFFNNAGIEGPVAAADDYPIEAFDQLFGVVLDPGGAQHRATRPGNRRAVPDAGAGRHQVRHPAAPSVSREETSP
jgi:NAD(P)-dependent dehydrogenase (short-subunit alcohol dehydrogenase family)